MPNAGNTPTFNRYTQVGTSVGYYSRVLFTYCSYNQDDRNFLDQISGWTNSANFDGIGELLTNQPDMCIGDYTLPVLYWKQGKNIRIRGTAIARMERYRDSGQYLNMRFGISDGTSVYWLAIQNKNFNHQYNDASTYNADNFTSIEFEAHIQSCGNPNGDGYMNSQGYYQYNGGMPGLFTPIGGSILNSFIYVPCWDNINAPATNITANETHIMFNFYGTDGGSPSFTPELYLSRLILEELA